MLKELIKKFGKDKINSFTKYPSILTLHTLGERGVLQEKLTTPIETSNMYATEKIDGTNVRIICYGDEYLIGAREFILHHSDDLYYATDQGIVDGIKSLGINIPKTKNLTVIYGEFYGGKTSSNSKQYGQDKIGFRVFDIAEYIDLSILELPLPMISSWREKETDNGIVYGQNFLNRFDMIEKFPDFEYVPLIGVELSDLSHNSIYNLLKVSLPETTVALSENAMKKPEGLILRNNDRSHIVKIRYEDYEKTLFKRKKI